jgi:hypothetical protein
MKSLNKTSAWIVDGKSTRKNKYNAHRVKLLDTWFDSEHERAVAEKLINLFPSANLDYHKSVIIKPSTNSFKQVKMSIDFCLATDKDIPFLWVEAKGYTTREFKLKLQYLEYFQPDIFQNLIFVFATKKILEQRYWKNLQHKVTTLVDMRKDLTWLM